MKDKYVCTQRTSFCPIFSDKIEYHFELLEIGKQITGELLKIKTTSYVLLDTELPKSGKMISRRSIRQNLETKIIKSAIYT